MPLVHKRHNAGNADEVVADKHYFTDKDGKLTTDSTEAAQWLVREGSPISKEVQAKYGIPLKGTAPKADKAKDDDDIDGEKASSPSSNKSAKPKANKSKGAK